ncbi:hypothetical protein NIBR502770_00420 [Pseudarthrobacter sp. NIBRBAC000502770]|nr:hypothetical protein NIBR502770_00420 [Pseudarthrobacter sp. NIBRBAC000502770]
MFAHANGGEDKLENLRVCCRKCNQSRATDQHPRHQPS